MSSGLIREYYTKNSVAEWKRLNRDPFHRLEFDTTMLFLKRYLPKRGLVLDAGGGPGRYTIELAKLGYDMVLLDFVPELLKIAKRKIKKEKVQDKVKQIVEGSLEDLSVFENDAFDSVLCLGGALCHLVSKKRRQKAVNELIRVTKDGAPIFVSVIGRLAVCMNSLVYLWPEMLEAPDVFRKYTSNGDYFGGWGFTSAHFYSIGELKKEFEHKTTLLQMVGLEGIFSPHPKRYNQVYRKKMYNELLWETHLKTCTDPCVVGASQHFMIIFRKRK
jgi:ubiquinone/menaquinone biosynthesis C-methylase UbiE